MTRPTVTRREFLAAAGAGGLLAATAGARSAPPQLPDGSGWILQSPRLPAPRIELPTDSSPAEGPRKRIAAITTAYYKYSHADDIITRFIEGYAVVGRIHEPHTKVVSLFIEQFPETDIGRGMAARYRIPLYRTPAEALTLGGKELAVDGVLLIGEHGDYPSNEKGQKLYPRRRLFEEIVKVFRASGRSVPVFNDKHLSYSWKDARWMVRQSRELGFPLMAGSSVPVTWRRPPLELKRGAPLEGALALGYGGLESYGFHTLECLQAFTERRRGGETGVRAVQCLRGERAWEAAERGDWSRELLDAALARVPKRRGQLLEADRDAAVFLVDYTDGLRAAAYLSRGHASEFAFAGKVRGVSRPAATWFYLPKPQRDHFSFLSNHVEKMFRTGKPSYPVDRTLLTTGMLAYLMDSNHAGGTRIETPELARIRYQS
ncbi:MAG: twin-arginine translocation signal domain-containing protein [Planctomycetota bacterium]|nr:twin-arginine translocation signal domain-containing protein [Planctomycetota bacterium]